ncbi:MULTISPECIES: ComZ family protein [Bacillus]|uniref:ComZ family protein n=1 Tax=Bacillus TaxID=1386 RepID=UPI00059716E3|nr:ComZ family protein [Bacillus safensis]APT49129.1 competence protein ComG [Bacillus safensis]APT54594.1 competence protein ComG [Bacillus safensis]KIL10041.1 hypothetical protein B4129_1075 [Bacillus safensis]MCZ2739594.1 ComZ family protein [Bacillus safensis]
MQHEKSMEFLQIAMKYFPQAKDELDKAGIQLEPEALQPLLTLFTSVMQEAYELGKADAESEKATE